MQLVYNSVHVSYCTNTNTNVLCQLMQFILLDTQL